MEAAGILPLGPSASSCTVRMHPTVLFTICDSFIRRNDGTNRVIGSLLGVVLADGTVDVRNAYAVPYNESSDQVALDIEYHHTMAELNQRVNPKEMVVGWYATGAGVSASDVLIQDFYARELTGAIHVTVDTSFHTLSSQASSLSPSPSLSSALKAYVSLPLSLGDRQLASVFSEVPLELSMAEADKIGVASLQQSSVDRLSSEMDGLESTLQQLEALLHSAHTYVTGVVDGRLPGDAAVGRALWDAVAAVPRLSSDSWERLFNSSTQDVLLVLYMANLTRAQLSLAEKLNSAVQPM